MHYQIINQVTEEKDLGVIYDNQINFIKHVIFASSKAMRMIEVTWKTFYSMPIDTYLSLYNSTSIFGIWKYGLGTFYRLELRM